jgi:hypothetical protein
VANGPNVTVDLGLVTPVFAMFLSGLLKSPEARLKRSELKWTLGGEGYLFSLTVDAAKKVISGLATWPPITESLLERRSLVN